MIAAEHDVDRRIRKTLFHAEAGIDGSGMRAGGEHGDAAARHKGGDEALIHDQGVRLAALTAKAVMADKACLIGGHALDRTAREEATAAKRMRVGMLDDLAAG